MAGRPRRYPRYEVDAYIDVVGPDVLLYHRIENLSLGGCCIQTSTMHDVGQMVDVVINFPELGTQVEILGQVVWANREPPQDIGIRWVDLDDERRDLLREYIQRVKTRQTSDANAN